jgi:hypothetical protein
MNPLGAVIFYFEFVGWLLVISVIAGIVFLPFSLLYSYFTKSGQ